MKQKKRGETKTEKSMKVTNINKRKKYLGDAVYADWDGFHIVLTANEGWEEWRQQRIALDPDVLARLREYIDRLERARRMEAKNRIEQAEKKED